MNIKDRIYFSNLTNYIPRGVKEISKECQRNIEYFAEQIRIEYFVEQIRITAKDALLEEIFPEHAKERILDLTDLIKKLKKESI